MYIGLCDCVCWEMLETLIYLKASIPFFQANRRQGSRNIQTTGNIYWESFGTGKYHQTILLAELLSYPNNVLMFITSTHIYYMQLLNHISCYPLKYYTSRWINRYFVTGKRCWQDSRHCSRNHRKYQGSKWRNPGGE